MIVFFWEENTLGSRITVFQHTRKVILANEYYISFKESISYISLNMRNDSSYSAEVWKNQNESRKRFLYGIRVRKTLLTDVTNIPKFVGALTKSNAYNKHVYILSLLASFIFHPHRNLHNHYNYNPSV